jgi:hypothetical protein
MNTLKTLASLALVALLAACASPKNASITDGKITGISSAEAVTLVKQDNRRQLVKQVQDDQKPIVKLVAHKDRPITIDAASFEVYVPIDPTLLLAEQPDAVSENIQILREVRGIGRETVMPIALGGMALADRNNARSAATAQQAAALEAQTAREAAQAEQVNRLTEALAERPPFLTVPEGAAVLPIE